MFIIENGTCWDGRDWCDGLNHHPELFETREDAEYEIDSVVKNHVEEMYTQDPSADFRSMRVIEVTYTCDFADLKDAESREYKRV